MEACIGSSGIGLRYFFQESSPCADWLPFAAALFFLLACFPIRVTAPTANRKLSSELAHPLKMAWGCLCQPASISFEFLCLVRVDCNGGNIPPVADIHCWYV